MEAILLEKLKEVEANVNHLNFNELNKYLINKFNLDRIHIDSILYRNKRITNNNFKYNHLIYIIAILLMDRQDEYLELSLIPKDPEDIDRVSCLLIP